MQIRSEVFAQSFSHTNNDDYISLVDVKEWNQTLLAQVTGNNVWNLYILNAVRCLYVRMYICTSVVLGVPSSVANDVIMRMTS